MELGLYLFPSRRTDEFKFGHMCVYWKINGNLPTALGFWPNEKNIGNIEDNSPNAIKNFLKINCIPGKIKNDIRMLALALKFPEESRQKNWIIDDNKIDEINSEVENSSVDCYSFSPCSHMNHLCSCNTSSCHNCVTWAFGFLRKYGVSDIPDVNTIYNGKISKAVMWFTSGIWCNSNEQ